MAASEHPFISLGQTVISEDRPSGVSVRYEAVFEQLEAELAKQESLSAASVDWAEVVKLASEILKSHSKDLLVSVYLCHALVETSGYTGLNVGLTIVNEMIDHHWEKMFPPLKRLRARKTAMQWLAEKTGRYVVNHTPADQDFDAVLEAAKLIREIDGNLAEKMGDAAPVLSDLARPLKQYKGSIQQQKAQADKASATPAQTSSAPAAGSKAVESPAATSTRPPAPSAPVAPRPTPAAVPTVIQVASDADARKGLRQIQENLRKMASFLLQVNITDPRPYRFSRMSAWLVIDQLPPNKDGLTQVSPPAGERRKQLDLLSAQGDHSKFIQGVEQTLSRAPFWLDGHRMSAQALSAMGPGGDAARKVVIAELSGFLKRLPTINDLKFIDASPFADDQTQLWLSTEVIPASTDSAGGRAVGNASSPENAPWLEALPAARKRASGGKMNEAIALFDQGLASASDLRAQFCWRRTLADFLIQTGKPRVAVRMLERLAEEAERFQLDQWEPGLSAGLYRLLSEAYLKLPGKKESDLELNARMERNYARLCWTDPAVAVTIK